MVDAHAVAALGLPKTNETSRVARASGTTVDQLKIDHLVDAASKAVEGEPKKFSMGVTLPTVPVRLVK